MKRLVSAVLSVVMVLGLGAKAFAFDDVAETHWAHVSIESCVEKKLVNGIGNNKYDPEGTLTRAHVAQLCYNAYGGRLTGQRDVELADVDEAAWYYDASLWMAANGLAGDKGEDGRVTYDPNAPADRLHLVTVLHRIANATMVKLPQTEESTAFSDVAELDAENTFAINSLQGAGVINGFPDGTFRPDAQLTRAQAAKIFDLLTEFRGMKPAPAPPKAQPAPPTEEEASVGVETADILANEAMRMIFSYAAPLGYTSRLPMYVPTPTGVVGEVLLQSADGMYQIHVFYSVADDAYRHFGFCYEVYEMATGKRIGAVSDYGDIIIIAAVLNTLALSSDVFATIVSTANSLGYVVKTRELTMGASGASGTIYVANASGLTRFEIRYTTSVGGGFAMAFTYNVSEPFSGGIVASGSGTDLANLTAIMVAYRTP